MVMGDLSKLGAGYARLKQGTLWSSTGTCKGFAASNPGEASKIDAYVSGLVSGGAPIAPTLATATGQGLVEIIYGGYGAPPLSVSVQGTYVAGQTLTATVTGG